MSGAPKPQNLMGINLGPLGYYLQNAAFKDLFKKSDSWRSSTNGTAPTWGTNAYSSMSVDSDGYPTVVPQNGLYAHIVCGHQLYTGEYTLLWDGTGDVNVQGFSYTSKSSNRKTFNVGSSSSAFFNVMITASSQSDHVHNIRLLIPNSEATYQAQPLNPDFVARVGGVGVIRTMDWTATNNSTHKTWSDRVTEFGLQGRSGDGSSGGLGGCSYEMCCDAANNLNSHLWICVPHQADDNYVTQMATLIKSRLKQNLHCYVEYSNETWNGQFQQTSWTRTTGQANGLLNLGYAPGQAWCAGINYCARRAAQIFKIFTTTFGGSDRLVRVIASQNGNAGVTDAWIMAINSPTINPLYQDPNARPDALATAPYLGVQNGSVNPADTVQSVIDKMVATMNSTQADQTFTGAAAAKKKADANGLRYIAYEGGQTLFKPSGNGANALLAQVNRSKEIEAVYKTYFDKWFAITQDVFCHYNDCFNDDVSGGNFWGLIQKQNEVPTFGKAKAFEDKVKSFVTQPVNAPKFNPPGSQVIPSHALIGDNIVLYGTNFDKVTSVTFNSPTAPQTVVPNAVTATTINVKVPTKLTVNTSGLITITDGTNTVTCDDVFKVDQVAPPPPPKVPTFGAVNNQVVPQHALAGTKLTINGTYLKNVDTVTFNSSPAVSLSLPSIVVTDTTITLDVPSTFKPGTNCSITLSDGVNVTTSTDIFVLDQQPKVPSFSAAGQQITPSHGVNGSTLILNGTNFDKISLVTFNTTSKIDVVPISVSPTQITVVVPASLLAGSSCTLIISDGTNSITSTDKFVCDATNPDIVVSTDWKNGFQNGFAYGLDQGSTHTLSASVVLIGTTPTTDYVDGYKHGYSQGYLFGYEKTH